MQLGDLRGRPVIVHFWASWCGPCVDEFPVLQKALTRHQADDLAVVGIVYRDSSEAARDFMARMGATWPAAMDPGELTAAELSASSARPTPSSSIADGIVVGARSASSRRTTWSASWR